MKQKVESYETEIRTDAQFDKPSWGYWRANIDGKRTALLELLELMETNNE